MQSRCGQEPIKAVIYAVMDVTALQFKVMLQTYWIVFWFIHLCHFADMTYIM